MKFPQAGIQILQTVLGVIIGMVLTILTLVLVSNQPTHQEVIDNQAQLMETQRVVLCIVLTPPEERTPDAMAACQAGTED